LVDVADGEGMTPLLHASLAGELSIVAWLLEHEADVNTTDNLGRSALYHAVKNMHGEVVQELLNWKPQLNLITDVETLLEAATGNVSIMTMLLDAGADIELQNKKNHTILNVAVNEKNPDIVKLLVDRKANIHHRGYGGWNAISLAADDPANAKVLRILAEGGANLRDVHVETGNTPLHFAAAYYAELTRILLEFRKGIDLDKPNNNGETALIYACDEDNVDCMKLLIRAGADINAEERLGWRALSIAVRRSLPLEIIDLLLSQPDIAIDAVGKTNGTALIVACRSLNHEMVTRLLAHGANANVPSMELSFNNTTLKSTCIPWGGQYYERKDQIDGIICELIAHGADINAMGGHTIYNAICAASLSAGVSTINLLLDKGASAQDADPLGRLPIHFAAASGIKNFEAVALVYRGDLMVCDRAGKNVLHWAAQFGNVQTVEAIMDLLNSSLRDRKECINQADIDGWTPLCWATRPFTTHLGPDSGSETRDYIKTVKVLLDLGADRSVKFNMGMGENVETVTPVQMARFCGAEGEIIDMLDPSLDDNSINVVAGKNSDTDKQTKRYISKTAFCNICLNVSTLVITQPSLSMLTKAIAFP
jgi:ankyrin repeat protein